MNDENSSISFLPEKQKYKIRKKSHFKKKSYLVKMKQWVKSREPKNTFLNVHILTNKLKIISLDQK